MTAATKPPSDVVALAQALIRIPSPSGGEAEIAAFVQRFFRDADFDCAIDASNTVIAWTTFGPGPVILMDGHIDTVAADAMAWAYPPFDGTVEEERLYGRGASDMKGALAAMMVAARSLILRDAGGADALTGTLVVTSTSWEERFEGYTLRRAFDLLSKHSIRPEAVILGEASELNIKRGQRGRTRLIVDVKGKPAHSAHPDAGVNAVYRAARLVEKMWRRPPDRDPVLGKAVRELIGIRSWPDPPDSVVPSGCRLTYDLRLLPGETPESVLAEFDGVIDTCRAEDPSFEAESRLATERLVLNDGTEEAVTAFPPAWLFSEDHPLVQTAVGALRGIGQAPAVTTYDFCTNGSFSAGIAGVPTIGYGPGKESTAHIVDEYIEIAELKAAAQGYAAIAAALLQG